MSRPDHQALFGRRCCNECGTVTASAEIPVVSGDLTLDRALRRATWKGRPVKLTPTHIDILEMLVQREGRVVQSWAFFIHVLDEECESNLLEVQLCKMRKAFAAVDPEFDQIQTVRGQGIMWRRELAVQSLDS